MTTMGDEAVGYLERKGLTPTTENINKLLEIWEKQEEELKIKPQQQRFEEIKQKAWEFYKEVYLAALKNGELTKDSSEDIFAGAWREAEKFHEFAKQKEGEMVDEQPN